MTNHIAIHILTAYPPSNPNRDEDGQPKTAVVGGKTRQRISSQCIKRAWRLSDPIMALDVPLAMRTRGLGSELLKHFEAAGMPKKIATDRAKKIAEKFGKIDSKKSPDHAEMVVFGHEEWRAAQELASTLAKENRDPSEEELARLPQKTVSLDCALFGRMRAADPRLNLEAAVSVSHSLTVNQASIDSDFWTSVDDLKQRDDDADRGSGGMGDVEFGSGVYYTYIDVDFDQLRRNLDGNEVLARDAVAALIKAIATSSPKGHRTTFAHHSRAGYVRAEIGESSGNLFCAAFEAPVTGMRSAIEALRASADREQEAYALQREVSELSVVDGKGSLAEVISAVTARLGT